MTLMWPGVKMSLTPLLENASPFSAPHVLLRALAAEAGLCGADAAPPKVLHVWQPSKESDDLITVIEKGGHITKYVICKLIDTFSDADANVSGCDSFFM